MESKGCWGKFPLILNLHPLISKVLWGKSLLKILNSRANEFCLEQEIIETIKYILDHVGKLVILMMSYGEPTGQPHPLFSLRFFADYLKQKIDFQIQFNEECLIKDFDEKI